MEHNSNDCVRPRTKPKLVGVRYGGGFFLDRTEGARTLGVSAHSRQQTADTLYLCVCVRALRVCVERVPMEIDNIASAGEQ